MAAARLARHKRSVAVIDQRPEIGGAAATAEFAPGFRAPILSHALGPIDAHVVRALRLDHAGLEFLKPDPPLTSLGVEGHALAFHHDPVLTAASIHQISHGDASRWRTFVQTADRISAVLAAIDRQVLPSIDDLGPRDWWPLLGVGRRMRALGKTDLARLARWLPMAVADLSAEFFESDAVRAAICARAVFGNFVGPWSAGTGAMLLQALAADPFPVGSGVTVKGGPGAVSQALGAIAEKAGAHVTTGKRVVRIVIREGRASGVVLEDGQSLEARAVIVAGDPKRALLELVDPVELPVRFRQRMARVRARGVTAKINLALSGRPVFPAIGDDPMALRGRLLIAPDVDYIERAFDAAKYGEISREPWLELAVPTVLDPGLAPEGGHVLSIYAHYAPRQLRGADWASARETLYRSVLHVLEAHTRGLEPLIVGRQIITPEDLERDWGASGGHIFHGEPTLDQAFIARPQLGWARHATPVANLFLASAGVHPGGGLTGLPGWLAAQTVEQTLSARRR